MFKNKTKRGIEAKLTMSVFVMLRILENEEEEAKNFRHWRTSLKKIQVILAKYIINKWLVSWIYKEHLQINKKTIQ